MPGGHAAYQGHRQGCSLQAQHPSFGAAPSSRPPGPPLEASKLAAIGRAQDARIKAHDDLDPEKRDARLIREGKLKPKPAKIKRGTP